MLVLAIAHLAALLSAMYLSYIGWTEFDNLLLGASLTLVVVVVIASAVDVMVYGERRDDA